MSRAAVLNTAMDDDPERQLARSEARYRGLLEAAPDAMVVVDEGGCILLVNVQAEKQFGYPRDVLLGRKVTDIIPTGFAERIIADGSRSSAEALAQNMGTGIELVAVRKDGGEFPIEIMLSPLDSADGMLVTAAIRDISIRKVAEEELARTERRYRGLLEAGQLIERRSEQLHGGATGVRLGGQETVEIARPMRQLARLRVEQQQQPMRLDRAGNVN